jgi:hypothetical protein
MFARDADLQLVASTASEDTQHIMAAQHMTLFM